MAMIAMECRVFDENLREQQLAGTSARNPDSISVDEFLTLSLNPRSNIPVKGYAEITLRQLGTGETIRELYEFECYQHRYQGPVTERRLA